MICRWEFAWVRRRAVQRLTHFKVRPQYVLNDAPSVQAQAKFYGIFYLRTIKSQVHCHSSLSQQAMFGLWTNTGNAQPAQFSLSQVAVTARPARGAKQLIVGSCAVLHGNPFKNLQLCGIFLWLKLPRMMSSNTAKSGTWVLCRPGLSRSHQRAQLSKAAPWGQELWLCCALALFQLTFINCLRFEKDCHEDKLPLGCCEDEH